MPNSDQTVKITVKVQNTDRGHTVRRQFTKRPTNKQIAELVQSVFREVYR